MSLRLPVDGCVLELTAEWHHAVMYHMEGRYVPVLLSQQEKQRVEELCEFGDVVPPTSLRHPKSFGCVIYRLTPVAVISQPTTLQIL